MKEDRIGKLLGAIVALAILLTLIIYGNIGTSILWHEKNIDVTRTPKVIAAIDEAFPTPYHIK